MRRPKRNWRNDRFWERVVVGSDDECWPWAGFLDGDGYGRARPFGVVQMYAHRLAWEIANGRSMGSANLACHTCDNPACCNPAHIYEGTHSSNLRDAYERGLKLPIRGSDHVGAKLSESDVATIKARLAAGEGPHSVAKDFPVSPPVIYRIKDGTKWAHVPWPT